MNTMTNLIKLHYSSIIALKKAAAVVWALAIVFSISNIDGAMLPLGAGLIIMILNYNTLAYEDNSKSQFLIYSLPVKPEQYILSKFIFGGMNLIIALIFGNAMYLILNIISSTSISMAALNIMIVIMGIFVIDILIPIAIIVGFTKARIILIFLAVLPLSISSAIAPILPKLLPLNFNISLVMVEAAVIICAIIFSILSYFVTANLYKKKDIV